jgi:hypothetical protein
MNKLSSGNSFINDLDVYLALFNLNAQKYFVPSLLLKIFHRLCCSYSFGFHKLILEMDALTPFVFRRVELDFAKKHLVVNN